MKPPARGGEHGQMLTLFALSLTVLLVGVGLVIDIGGAWGQQRTQQKVADSAALAGATKESNGGTRSQIIAAAVANAVANGYAASEVTVNMPPTSGSYAPGGSQAGALSTNDCSTPALYPCWVEVIVSRPHQNTFAAIPPFGQASFNVSGRGVAVGGIANTVTNGVAPIMFSYRAVPSSGTGPDTSHCSPQNIQCPPQNPFPLNSGQFSWTTFCVSQGNCNVNASTAKSIIDGGNFQVQVNLGMYLGPHNNGGMTSVCADLLSTYPNGADLPVAISNDNGDLIGFWIWHFDPLTTDCNVNGAETIGGYFVSDITANLPLTITAGGGSATFGEYVVRLVE